MYTKYFGFNEKPFTLTPNPRFIYLSKNHKEAFAHLLYGINNHYGFIELIGEVGTGKTTILRTLLNQLQDDTYRTALIVNPCLTGVELLRSICREFDLTVQSDQAVEYLEEINNFLLSETAKGRTVVLIIDEAQNLEPAVLEQIRLISNLETESDKLIQIVLAGQPEFAALLGRPELRQLNQRIAVRYRLKSMDMHETHNYIRHRIEVAGETGSVTFSRFATRLISMYTLGIPRMINKLCDRCLLIAYANEQRRITAGVVIRAIIELLSGPARKRFFIASAAVIILAVFCLTKTENVRHVLYDTKIFNSNKPVASPASPIRQIADFPSNIGTSVVIATPEDRQSELLKKELLSLDQKSVHLQAFNSIAETWGVRRITILDEDSFTVPEMLSRTASRRKLRVSELKGSLEDAIGFNVPFLVVTKFSDASGPYCIAVIGADKDSVTTSPVFFGRRTLSKNGLNSIASGTFYLIQKEAGKVTDKTKPELKRPFLSITGSSK